MPYNVVTVQNVDQIEYTALVELLSQIYTKEIPETSMTQPLDLDEVERLSIYFANQHSYMVELWAVLVHQVRLLKRIGGNKEAIEECMDKRDYIEQIVKTLKIKQYTASHLLRYNKEQ